MKTFKPKPSKINVFAQIDKEHMLTDKRNKGIIFGRVEDVARQYDVSIKEDEFGLIFTAPKNRLQIFVEKLHFSGIPYWEV